MGPEDAAQRRNKTRHTAPEPRRRDGRGPQLDLPSPDALANDLLHLYLGDLERGGARSLAEYQASLAQVEGLIGESLAAFRPAPVRPEQPVGTKDNGDPR